VCDDDHYIANEANKHVDTSAFEESLEEVISGLDLDRKNLLETIYFRTLSATNIPPVEPSDDQLICRYLTLDKFLRFIHTRRISFPTANQFSDPWECRIAHDYETAIYRVLNKRDISTDEWTKLVNLKAADWNVSCWTKLDHHFDDHLLWHAYAEGPIGVGITVRYGTLRKCLSESSTKLARDKEFFSGLVNYETPTLLPFNKHPIYRNEREVRFAFRAFQPGLATASVDEIFQSFGIRISPAATVDHHDTIRRLWLQYGGEDRVQWPQ
jgi:hypothetical protein